MTIFDPEMLRADALAELGPSGDARARDDLGNGVLEVVPSDLHWSGTAGDMRTHRVLLGLDGRSLAIVRAYPSVEDALCGALSKAIGKIPGEALHELTLYWGLEERREALDYRSSAQQLAPIDRRLEAPHSEAMILALRGYLEALGFTRASTALARASTSTRRLPSAIEVTLHAHPDDVADFGQDEDMAVERALRDLASGARRESVRIVRASA